MCVRVYVCMTYVYLCLYIGMCICIHAKNIWYKYIYHKCMHEYIDVHMYIHTQKLHT
jgi:hypothetical protein